MLASLQRSSRVPSRVPLMVLMVSVSKSWLCLLQKFHDGEMGDAVLMTEANVVQYIVHRSQEGNRHARVKGQPLNPVCVCSY